MQLDSPALAEQEAAADRLGERQEQPVHREGAIDDGGRLTLLSSAGDDRKLAAPDLAGTDPADLATDFSQNRIAVLVHSRRAAVLQAVHLDRDQTLRAVP
jgi:hypothetical protein